MGFILLSLAINFNGNLVEKRYVRHKPASHPSPNEIIHLRVHPSALVFLLVGFDFLRKIDATILRGLLTAHQSINRES